MVGRIGGNERIELSIRRIVVVVVVVVGMVVAQGWKAQ